jgi:phosphatidylglycerol:prolipoprotein diacylglycerol transferase
MHPVLYPWHAHPHEASWVVGSYGACLLLAILVSTAVCTRLGRGVLSAGAWFELVSSVALMGLLGAKLLAVGVLAVQGMPSAVLWREGVEGGGVWLGGPLFAAPLLLAILRRRGGDWRAVAVPLLVALPAAHAVGRIGCFLGGCCFGRPTGLPWGVRYTHALAEQWGAPIGIAVHPVPLYECALELANFALLLHRRRAGDGFGRLAATWLACYGAQRFLLEFLRGDARGQWAGLSTSQWLALGLLAGAAAWFARRNGPLRCAA